MKVIDNEQVFCFDVDQTIISARRTCAAPGDINVVNPYTQEIVFFKPHYAQVNLLKEMHGRGRYIVVWSASGVKWAEEIVKCLKIEAYVDIVQTKPLAYIDDKEVQTWLNNRIFLDDGERV